MTDNIDILRKFADAFRSGAQGSTMDCDDAQKVALAIDGVLEELAEWKQAASVEAGVRRELAARVEADDASYERGFRAGYEVATGQSGPKP